MQHIFAPRGLHHLHLKWRNVLIWVLEASLQIALPTRSNVIIQSGLIWWRISAPKHATDAIRNTKAHTRARMDKIGVIYTVADIVLLVGLERFLKDRIILYDRIWFETTPTIIKFTIILRNLRLNLVYKLRLETNSHFFNSKIVRKVLIPPKLLVWDNIYVI